MYLRVRWLVTGLGMVAMEMFFVKNQDYLQAVNVDDVYFFTKENSKVVAVLKSSKVELTVTLYQVNELLSYTESFFRCHKSYVVNLKKIEKISRYNNKTYNIKFNGIKEQAYMTEVNLRIIKRKFLAF